MALLPLMDRELNLMLAFKNTLHTEKNRDAIIFDMPPTALTMRFLSLPFITLVWLEALLELRGKIAAKKQIILKIKLGKREFEQDKVKIRLQASIDDHLQLQEIFTNDRTDINLLLNNDPRSLASAVRTRKKLKDIGIEVRNIVLNEVKNGEMMDEIAYADKRNCSNGHFIRRFACSDQRFFRGAVGKLRTGLL